MATVKRFIGICALVCMYCLPVSAKYTGGGGDPVKLPLDGGRHQIHKDSSVTVQNNYFYDPTIASQINGSYPIKNVVTLKVKEDTSMVIPSAFNATVAVSIVYYNYNGVGPDTVHKSLTVSYDSATGHTYKSRSSFAFSNAQKVQVIVDSVSSNVAWDVTTALLIENELAASPRFKFSCTDSTIRSFSFPTPAAGADELAVSWANVTAADKYDLEWMYADSSAVINGVYGSADPQKIFANNASRVTIAGTSYNIPLIYDNSGILYFRVRPVQENPDGSRIEAIWSSSQTGGLGLGAFSFRGHERGLNWQSTISYAEDGKRKVVVQYYDGSLRSRQTVTKDNTTNTTIVAETFYDYQGRPAIQVMPAPTLNTIIGYSRRFNTGLNGAEYDRSNYDTLTSPAVYCSTSAAAMGDTSGATHYYSTANTERNGGFNKFIPDAQEYPFTEIQYTQDNTGRIQKQSGVGPDHKLGSGHETQYFYGSPSQIELDALFGTEAGNNTHYFKNMVKDANGQYSVSYVDMNGHAIATALAGDGSGTGTTVLSSNIARTETEKLSDSSSSIIRDMVMETKMSLLVSTPGIYTFNYALDPATLKEVGCNHDSVCYDCLYDLEIQITDDCNNQKLGGKPYDTLVHNFSLNSIDTTCSQTGFHFSFPLTLSEGNYEITKSLSINRSAMQYYQDSVFMKHNVCTTQAQFISTQQELQNTDCVPTCKACQDSLGTWDDFRTRYMQVMGIDVADSAANRQAALNAYQSAVDNCKALCDSSSSNDDISRNMLMDVSPPSGQYANPANPDKYSIFYTKNDDETFTPPYKSTGITYINDDGSPSMVYDDSTSTYVIPQKLSPEEFADKFQDSWAPTLLQFHPEYCKLTQYNLVHDTASARWEKDFSTTDTYVDAYSRGFMNPTNYAPARTDYPNTDRGFDPLTNHYKTQLSDRVISYMPGITDSVSIWSAITIMAKCSGSTDPGCAVHYGTIDSTFSHVSMCTGDLDMAWRNFQQAYLQMRNDVINAVINTTCTSPTSTQLVAAGHQPNFNTGADALNQNGLGAFNGYNAATGAAAGQAAVRAAYVANCQRDTSLWKEELSICSNYTGTTALNYIIPRLLQVAIKGSDVDHPYGSSTISPDSSATGSLGTYSSFEDVIDQYNTLNSITDVMRCNSDLITAPLPYDHQASYANKPLWTKPDSCECSIINNLYTEYQGSGGTDTSFSAYLLRTRHDYVSDSILTVLRGLCNASSSSCTYLTAPIYLPPALQCNIGDVCASCIVINNLYDSFRVKYPTVVPTIDQADTVQQQKNTLFANYMNNRLGFGKQSSEYLAFLQQCESSYFNQSGDTTSCTYTFPAGFQPADVSTCFASAHNAAYGRDGSFVYASVTDTVGTYISDSNAFWENVGDNDTDGRLNQCGIWLCDSCATGQCLPLNTWIGFTRTVYIPATDTVFIGMGADNQERITIDGAATPALQQLQQPWRGGFCCDGLPFYRWHIYPVYLTKGYHSFLIEGWNSGNVATIGAEIYAATRSQMVTGDTNVIKSLTLFSTKSIGNHTDFTPGYVCPVNYQLDSIGGNHICKRTGACTATDGTGTTTGTNVGTFMKQYQDSVSAYLPFTDITPTPDNGSIVSGSGNGSRATFLSKLNSAGEVQWSKMYSSLYSGSYYSLDGFNKIFATADSGCIAVGSNLHGTGNWFLTKISNDGNVAWSKALPDDMIGVPQHVVQTADGGYVVLGSIFYNNTDIGVMKFDSNGNLSWSKTLGTALFDGASGIIEDNDSLVIIGYSINASDGLNNSGYTGVQEGLFFKLEESTGNMVIAKSFHIGTNNNYPNAIYKTSTGYKISVSTGADGPDYDPGIVSFDVDHDGNGIKARWLNKTSQSTINPLTSSSLAAAVIPTSDNGTVAINTLGDSSAFAVEKIDTSGNVVWAYRSVIHNITNVKSYLTKAIVSSSGSILLAGITDDETGPSANYAGFLRKLTSSGLSCSDSIYTPVNDTLAYVVYNSSNFLDEGSGGVLGLSTTIRADNYLATSQTNCEVGGYYGPYLCGKSEPLFPAIAVDSVTNCYDNNFFAVSKGMTQYQKYADSLKNSFETDYRNKCLKAYQLEHFTVTHPVNEYHYTLYYYDQAGNLVKTVPPAGVVPRFEQSWLDSVSAARVANTSLPNSFHTLTTEYRYNTLNQVIAQNTPDAGTSHFWYDRLGRLTVSQNAKQAAANPLQYSYTLYDIIGRVVEVGQLNYDVSMDDATSRNESSLNTWIAAGVKEQVTRTIYDSAYPPFEGYPTPLKARNLRNRVAWTALYNTADDLANHRHAVATFYSYDIEGNVDTLIQDYKQQGWMGVNNRFKKLVYQYDLVSDKVNSVAYQPNEVDAFYHRYTYDAENQITNVETSRDSLYWEQEAFYQYYKHGPLGRSIIGQQQVQGLDYAYTLHGWIKAVNPAILATGGANGNGTGCSDPSSAVNDLIINARASSGAPTQYTAKNTITFEDGFSSNASDTFQTNINSSATTCTSSDDTALNNALNSVDGSPGTIVARDAYSYMLNYYATDYTPIGQGIVSPSISIPGQLGVSYYPLFNGNITSMSVNISKLNSPMVYNYKYDQLHRLLFMQAWKGSSTWSGLTAGYDYMEKMDYDANGNISYYQRAANNGSNLMDDLTYNYNPGTNQLNHIHDGIPDNNFQGDIDSQPTDNYTYDPIGNLTKDTKDSVVNISWTVYGKISSVTKGDSTHIYYTYDAAGNRISKSMVNSSHDTTSTFYVRDASGNVMSVYTSGNTSINSRHTTQTEVHLYGRSRLGIWHPNTDVDYIVPDTTIMPGLDSVGHSIDFTRGNKFYELSNHLGNILVTITDKKIQKDDGGDGIVDWYDADVASAQDYYPFGMLQPGRQYNNGSNYRYGFNGKEKSDEMEGNGVDYDYGMRIYDARVGRFLSADPLTAKYAFFTPYQFASNTPILAIDLDGLEGWPNVNWGGDGSPYDQGTAEQRVKDAERAIYKADPKHADEIIYEKNKEAFLWVGSMITAGSGTLWTWFLRGVTVHGTYKIGKGLITKNTSDVKDGVNSIAFVIFNKVVEYVSNEIGSKLSDYFMKTMNFRELGYTYESQASYSDAGEISISHYVTKGEQKILVGYSTIKDGVLTNVFDVPKELQRKGISTAMYAELEGFGFTKIKGAYLNGSGDWATNFKEFMKVYDPAKNNLVEAARATPAGKAMGKGWTPTNIVVKKDAIYMDWIKTK